MIYRTSNIEVDPNLHQIRQFRQVVSLRPRTFRLLLALLKKPGEIISKQSLLEQVWDDVVVNDQVLFQSIKEIRKLCGDSNVIVNYPRRGYAWVAPVEIIDERDSQNYIREQGWFSRVSFAFMLFGLVGFCVFAYSARGPSQTHQGSVVVLPVVNKLVYPDQRWVKLGAMDTLIQGLSEKTDYPVMQTEDVLGLIRDIDSEGGMETEQLVQEIFRARNVSKVIEVQVNGAPSEYQLIYSLHTAGNKQRGMISGEQLQQAFSELLELLTSGGANKKYAKRSDYYRRLANELFAAGIEELYSENYSSAEQYLRAVLQAEPDNLAAKRFLGEIILFQDRYDEADRILSTALQQSTEQNLTLQRGRLLYWMGISAISQNRHDDGLEFLSQARSVAHAANDWVYRAYAAGNMGKIYRFEEKYDEAAASFKDAIADLKMVNYPGLEANMFMRLARLAFKQQRGKATEAYLKRVFRIANQNQLLKINVNGLLLLSEHLHKNGQTEVAQQQLEKASQIAMNNPKLMEKVRQLSKEIMTSS